MPRKNKRKPEYRRLKYNTKFSDQDKGYNSFHKKYEKRTDVITINPRASTKPSSKKTQPNQSKPSRTERGEVNAQNVPNAPINTPYKYAWKDGNPMPRRGEIWYVDLGEFDFKSVEKGCRPAVIISMDKSNEKAGNVTLLPMTSRMKKEWYSSHIPIDSTDVVTTGASKFSQSLILIDQIRTVDKADLVNRVGIVSHQKMLEVEDGIRAWMGV